MNLDEYQKAAMRTSNFKSNAQRLLHAVYGMVSEYDELMEIVSMDSITDADREHMIKEAGDCIWFVAEALTSIEVDMSYLENTKPRNIGQARANRMKLTGMLQKYLEGRPLEYEKLKHCIEWYYHKCIQQVRLYTYADRDVILRTNIEKLKKRFPNGFELDRSINRAEDDI